MILSAGLSPAWQNTLVFDRVRRGEVNRAREAHWNASGKVINAARAVQRLGGGGPGSPLCPGIALTVLGGPAGGAIASALSAENLRLRSVQSRTPTRVCTTMIDRSDGSITELVENAGPVAAAELEEFESVFRREAPLARAVVLTGSLPAGAPPGTYRSLLSAVSVPAILDARGEELLAALELRPFLVKPNREELGKTVGRPILDEAALREAMADLNRRGAQWVLVSQGRDAVWAHGEGKYYRFRPPQVPAVNPIGSGDCLAGGIAWATAEGASPLEAIRIGIAAGADNASVLLPGDIDRERVDRLSREVAWEEV